MKIPSKQFVTTSIFAYGGARACSIPTKIVPAPDLLEQVQIYLAKLQNDKAYQKSIRGYDRVHTIWAGANDIFMASALTNPVQQLALINGIADCVYASAKLLLTNGQNKVVIFTQATIDRTALPDAVKSSAALALRIINQSIKTKTQQLMQEHANATVVLYDAYAEMVRLIEEVGKAGWNTTHPCIQRTTPNGLLPNAKLVSKCNQPWRYVYW